MREEAFLKTGYDANIGWNLFYVVKSMERGAGKAARELLCLLFGIATIMGNIGHLQPLGLDGSLIEWPHIHSGTRCFP
jgi:hypothetical protein